MNFSYVWKVMSGLPVAYTTIIIVLFAGAIVGALIALWNAVPLALEHVIEMWKRHSRRTARKRRHSAQGTARQDANGVEHRYDDAPAVVAPGGRLASKAWLVVAGCSAASVLGGVALGYVLNRPPDKPSLNARLTEAVHDPARLRIDYELRSR
ncbi:MAG: hypothetical protein ACXWIP_25625 [Burkholderiales bacterium]